MHNKVHYLPKLTRFRLHCRCTAKFITCLNALAFGYIVGGPHGWQTQTWANLCNSVCGHWFNLLSASVATRLTLVCLQVGLARTVYTPYIFYATVCVATELIYRARAQQPPYHTYTCLLTSRVGQNRIYTPFMTVYLVIFLSKKPYTHHTYMVLANPTYMFWDVWEGLGFVC